MQRISGSRIAPVRDPGREIVQRLAEMGYQLEPGALKIICGYSGSKDELLRRIVDQSDGSVAVIDSSQVSCILSSSAASAIQQDRLIHVYGGGGHTTLVMGEMFFRAGGLANINPIMETGLSVFNQALKYLELERCVNYGRSIMKYFRLEKDDVLTAPMQNIREESEK